MMSHFEKDQIVKGYVTPQVMQFHSLSGKKEHLYSEAFYTKEFYALLIMTSGTFQQMEKLLFRIYN